ncbi:MAG TPA: DinB family protein [Pyrinomonadaceae bacterium]|jgi:uncharacterized damage-inducible protein DinB
MQINVNVIKDDVEHKKPADARQYHTARTSEHLGELMQWFLPAVLLCLFAPAAIVFGQGKPAAASAQDNPLSATNKRFYGGMKNMLLLSAQKVPEEYYSFKPTDAVRSFGQIIGHAADSQYAMCSIVLGEKNPSPNIEKNKTSKSDLIASLKDAFAYCDRAYDGMTDTSAAQMVKFMGRDNTKFGVLTANLIHSGLHYGNLVTYMRLKNIVPPTSEPGFFEPPKK